MEYILILFIVLFVIGYIDYKLNKRIGEKILDNIRNNLNIIKLIGITLLFVSGAMLFNICMEEWGFMSSAMVKFEVSMIPYLVYATLGAPLIEEYAFRYLPYKVIKKRKLNILIMIVSSILFTLVHKAEDFEYLFYFIVAITLSIIFLKTGNILYSIIPHSVYNLVKEVCFFTGFGSSSLFLVILVLSVIIIRKGGRSEE